MNAHASPFSAETPTIDPARAVGALAAARPEWRAVLERRRIDYCCHGSRTLAEACASAGAPCDEVMRELRDARASGAGEASGAENTERAWTDATMTELADHIERTHHWFARSVLEQLGSLAPRVAQAHAANHPRLQRLAEEVAALIADMRDHMVREERVLFPWLRRLENPAPALSLPPWSVRRPIDCMEHDHAEVAGCFERMRGLTDGFTAPGDACASYHTLMDLLRALEIDTRLHIHLENNVLFPAGERAERRRDGRDRATQPHE